MKFNHQKRVRFALAAVFLSLAAVSSPLVPDLPKGGEAELLEVYRDAAMHGSPKAMCVRMKDATFDIDPRGERKKLD